MKLLFIGDIVGKSGRKAVKELLPLLVSEYSPDIVIANGENAANGFGVTARIAQELFDLGIDVLTSGNHIWDKKDVLEYIQKERRLIRPANYPDNTPGMGSVVIMTEEGHKVAVLNLSGRVFMDPLDCPFKIAEKEIKELRKEAALILVDFHAEATSEKIAAGWELDGRVTAVLGTHTHVQTADERILPGGTAYISDVGMTGSFDSVIGMDKNISIERFKTQMPISYRVAKDDIALNGVLVDADEVSGKAINIIRVQRRI
jgi:metallophosphoesterase (TIGR00282 family)